MYGAEAPTVNGPEMALVAVAGLLLLFLFVWMLWRWDVKHEGRFRLPKALEARIDEFVRAVAAWDFEAAEVAVSQAFWSFGGEDGRTSSARH